MLKLKFFTGMLICFLLASCADIDMSNTGAEITQEICKANEGIDLYIYGNYTSEEKVLGGTAHITVDKADGERYQSFWITKLDGKELDSNNRLYSRELDSYHLPIVPQNNTNHIDNFDRELTILLREPGKYILCVDFRMESDQIIGGYRKHNYIKLPFTVIE